MSPHIFLCTCIPDVSLRDAFQHYQHDIDCPVRDLRLRQHPAGAEWTGEVWLFHREELHEFAITPKELLGVLRTAHAVAIASECNISWLLEVRRAFCEPELKG